MPVLFIAMLMGALLAVSWLNDMFLYVLLGMVLAWYGTYSIFTEMMEMDAAEAAQDEDDEDEDA